MNRPAVGDVRCTVERGELLPPGSGGAEALCAEIDEATAGLPVRPTVAVRVVSPSLLAAVVTVGGQALPEVKLARADGALDRMAFRRFAQSIATIAARQP